MRMETSHRSGAGRRGAAGSPLRFLEAALFTAAVIGLGLFAREMLGAWTFQRTAGARFDRAAARAETTGKQPSPDTAKDALARLEIPRLGLSKIVVDGADKKDLSHAVGRIPWGGVFGGTGTVGLAGHRDTHFRKLADVAVGDTLRVTTLAARYTYVVEDTRVVEPDDVEILAPTGRPRLALVTCYPFHYIGPAPHRYVVEAREVEARTVSARRL